MNLEILPPFCSWLRRVCLGSREEEIQTPGEDIGALEARVTSGCGLPWMVLELNWGPLQELQFSHLCGQSLAPSTAPRTPALLLGELLGHSPISAAHFTPGALGLQPQITGVQRFVWVPGLSLSSLGRHSERVYPQNLGTSAQLCFHGKALQLSWEGTSSLAGTWQTFFGMSRNCWGRRVLRTGCCTSSP